MIFLQVSCLWYFLSCIVLNIIQTTLILTFVVSLKSYWVVDNPNYCGYGYLFQTKVRGMIYTSLIPCYELSSENYSVPSTASQVQYVCTYLKISKKTATSRMILYKTFNCPEEVKLFSWPRPWHNRNMTAEYCNIN